MQRWIFSARGSSLYQTGDFNGDWVSFTDHEADKAAALAAKDARIAELEARVKRLRALERARREREVVLKSQPDDWQVLAELAQDQADAKLAVDAHRDLEPTDATT